MTKVACAEPAQSSDFSVDQVPHKHCGNHVCGIYHSEEEFEQIVSAYIAEGLRKGEKIAYLWNRHPVEDLTAILSQILRKSNIDFRDCVERKQFTFFHSDEVYVIEGSFSPDETISRLFSLYNQSMEEGYPGLRVTGEMSWVLGHRSDSTLLNPPPGNNRLIEYEARLATFFQENHCSALCQYDARHFSAPLLLSVLDTHPQALIDGEEFENFFFIPPDQLLVNDVPASILKHRIKNLKYRKRVEESLRERSQQLLLAKESIQQEVAERQKMSLAKEAAEKLSKAKSEFLAVMSHEIRTPLNGIICMANFIQETILTQEQKEYLEVIKVSSDHLMTVLNDVLDWSKIESNKLELEKKPLEIEKAIKGVVDMFKGTEKLIHISHHIDNEVPKGIIGDITRLRQILFNLVSNAVKFTPDGGSVNIQVKRAKSGPETPQPSQVASNDSLTLFCACPDLAKPSADQNLLHLEFSVQDTGIGIPADKMDLIFSSFTQVDSSITRKYGGTGLGLAISKKLVEMMHGRIWLQSQEHVGSKFSFTIETRETELSPNNGEQSNQYYQQKQRHRTSRTMEHTSPSPVNDSSSGGLPVVPETHQSSPPVAKRKREVERPELRILLAEDNPINQKIILRLLQNLGHNNLTLVQNGREAAQKVTEADYDVVFMDLQMPDMDGLAATRLIMEMDWEKRVRPVIIAMTASALQSEKLACYQAGMDFHISKPLKTEIIQSALLKIQSGKKLKQYL
eukprot:TRINITY_DN3204_c0_g1_i4.p1 TRINITY_DN3204_c0_g1~~TRINITY_DN3204_c0_g1_i4.p1  ORF type:complete len:757 (-),score=158.81 TRINITY_DN3204_c0_g1_i4:89-2305(-)